MPRLSRLRRRWAMRGVATAAIAALLAAACGGSPTGGLRTVEPDAGATAPATTGTPAAGLDACTLLTDAEIEQVTGTQVAGRAHSNLTTVLPSVCDIDMGHAQLTVGAMSMGGRAFYETHFEPFIGDPTGLLTEPVSGIGDKAAHDESGYIMAVQGDALIEVHYINPSEGSTAGAEQMMRLILAKLPCLAAGCPGFTLPPSSTARAADACALLTDDEIERATGIPTLGSGQSGTGRDPSCRWTLDTDLAGLHWIELTVMAPGGRAQFDYLANDFYENRPEHLPGLGDDAMKTATIPGGSVYAVTGDKMLTFNFELPLSVDDPYPLVVPLVEIALSRI